MSERMAPPPPEFATFVEEHLGLYDETPICLDWDSILRQRLGATRSSNFDSYRNRLTTAPALREEVAQLAQLMTVGETYFFRDSRQFEALTTVVLPELLHRRSEDARIQILSVACSSGEEPYSVAIAARELLGDRANRIQIHAFDVNPSAIARAERAVYSEWALRATPVSLRERHFKRQGNQYVLSDTIRGAVSFETRNLFDEDAEFWRAQRFDVVLCRNALIYFSRRKITAALRRFADILSFDGTLFLGNAETPRGFEDRLVPQELCGSFCYRLGDSESTPRPVPISPTTSSVVADAGDRFLQRPNLPNYESSADGATWVTAIEGATRRLAVLVENSPVPSSQRTTTSTTTFERNTVVAEALRLIASERFSEALTHLDSLTAIAEDASELGLLRATILTNQGRLIDAIDICRRLLVDDPHCAGAYHLLGVASENLGKHADAQGHYETAITLDPNFAMSHWFLGRLYLRAQTREPARRHLSTALRLWQLESPQTGTNATLFTGGFGRETLERLCRADLANCEMRRR